MTWTYTSTDPSGTTRDQVRTYIGDTDSTDPLLTDEQIAFALSEAGTVKASSALAADWIAASFARKADKSMGDLSITYSQMAAQYTALANRLRSEMSRTVLPALAASPRRPRTRATPTGQAGVQGHAGQPECERWHRRNRHADVD
jgi:hypothetical protein